MVDEDAQNIQRQQEQSSTLTTDPDTRSRPNLNESRTASGIISSRQAPYDSAPQESFQQRPPASVQPVHLPSQQAASQMARGQASGSFSMSGMAGALPEYQSFENQQASSLNQQHGFGGPSPSVAAFQSQPFSNQVNHTHFPIVSSQYGTPFQDQLGTPAVYGSAPNIRHHQTGGPSPIHSAFPVPYYSGHHNHHPQQQPQYLPYANHYGQNNQAAFQASYAPGSSANSQTEEFAMYGGRPSQASFRTGGVVPPGMPSQYLRPGNISAGKSSPNSSGGSIPSTPRGPPRKPKQSGHALWVGNLPSGTVVGDLKEHFSKDATRDIESVFLISKSNCAFVNYRTEAACAAAMTRFHDSRFNGVRLVCRLRRSTAVSPGPGVPTGPAALMLPNPQAQNTGESKPPPREPASDAPGENPTSPSLNLEPAMKTSDKYFVMKSLTVEDMELSVRNSIWATQGHNEDALNKAFELAENVYLIFSANKSGEYFGYARMVSAINEESAANLDWAPRGQTVTSDPDLPRSIPTQATESAPRGRIIDDSARGTIFWEADLDDQDAFPTKESDTHEAEQAQELEKHQELEGEKGEDAAASGDVQTFGRPFKIEWVNTNRLPFYKTRGLRNPWNANREVKIARDGTELETGVGRRLTQMFHRAALEPSFSPYGQTRPF